MRFNVKRILGGANILRHAVKNVYGSLKARIPQAEKPAPTPKGPKEPKAPPLPGTVPPKVKKPPKVRPPKPPKQPKIKQPKPKTSFRSPPIP